MTTVKKSGGAFDDAKYLVDRLAKLTSTIPGLDASLMLVQYSSPFVIALLLRLAKFRADHPRVRLGQSAKVSLGPSGGASLTRLAEGWGKAAGSIADARVIMRAFGLLPVVSGLFKLYPNPLHSLLALLRGGQVNRAKLLPTMKILALLGYYPLEHISWLASKGVLPLSPAAAGMSMLWAVRFWALYVLLELYRLRHSYISLTKRTRALRTAKPTVTVPEAEGYELTPSTSGTDHPDHQGEDRREEKAMLRTEWAAWKNATLVNSAYAPLTIHWSTPGGLWASPFLTAWFGTTAAIGQLANAWRQVET